MSRGQDSEALVEKCFISKGNEVSFLHAKRHSNLDAEGIDFKVKFLRESLNIDLQVKTSPDSQTLGLVLPLPRRPSPALKNKISDRMKWQIISHISRHHLVNCILFVGKVDRGKREQEVLNDIWREVMKIFKIVKRQRRKG